MTMLPSLRQRARGPLLQVVKTSVAVVVAWVVCDLVFDQPPIFAAIAALLVVQPSVNQTVVRGLERSVGVILGVVLAFGLGYLVGDESWVVLSAVVLALLLSWVFRLGPGSANQIPISAMLVLSIGALTPAYAVERIIETIIGAAAGLVVNVAIVPPVLVAPAHAAVLRLGRDLAARIDDIASLLTTPQTPGSLHEHLESARELRGLQGAGTTAIAAARESLTFNPRSARMRRLLDEDEALFDRLSSLVTRVIGMTRTVNDRWHPGLLDEAVVRAIAGDLGRAAHDLRLVVREQVPDRAPTTAELPALTAPLVVGTPDRGDWVLIGSLLEDLRRVREEIIGEE
ncbi:aromatic acid exporter family protein [Galbitalea sp. SE-J8]|uniref:FUSC family protein n=1 Tax=Galbitalea sp. SE-J8 TaxID=3054952 RepID=UPI00259D14E0|nr:FUSC family protein [Galbitalea sp. SE-J8]MDM4761784.1 aromatic acid exporter family protein [Galbitalea sp. SE-J8]